MIRVVLQKTRANSTVAIGLLWFVVASAACGEEPIAVAAGEAAARMVVFRLSDATLQSLIEDKALDRIVAVRDNILGTEVYGKARVVGTPRVGLVPTPDQAAFQITLNGSMHSRTIGYNGPAIIHSRSVTNFTAIMQVAFQPGNGFVAGPPQVSARTQLFPESIGSRRGGLIGWLIRRRAAKIAASRQAEATEVVRQRAEQRVALAFRNVTDERLAQANLMPDIKSLASAVLRTTGNIEPKYQYTTTPRYLQITATLGERAAGEPVATSSIPATLRSPVEIWLLGESLPAKPPGSWDQLPRAAADFLKTISSRSQRLAQLGDITGPLRKVLAQDYRTENFGPWRVVQIGPPVDQSAALVQGNGRPRQNAKSSVASALEKIGVTAAQALTEAPPHRTWRSGKYSAEAEFLALEGEVVRLRRTNGIKTSIPLAKLSPADQQWIAAHMARPATGN